MADGDTGGAGGFYGTLPLGVKNPPASPLHPFGRYRKDGSARPEGKVTSLMHSDQSHSVLTSTFIERQFKDIDPI